MRLLQYLAAYLYAADDRSRMEALDGVLREMNPVVQSLAFSFARGSLEMARELAQEGRTYLIDKLARRKSLRNAGELAGQYLAGELRQHLRLAARKWAFALSASKADFRAASRVVAHLRREGITLEDALRNPESIQGIDSDTLYRGLSLLAFQRGQRSLEALKAIGDWAEVETAIMALGEGPVVIGGATPSANE